MISFIFRILLVACSFLTAFYMVKRIRASKLEIEDAIFWILFAFALIIISIFPQLAIVGARLLGIYSSTNFIFLVILFLVLIKLFLSTIKISELNDRLRELTQKIAIEEKLEREAAEEKEE